MIKAKNTMPLGNIVRIRMGRIIGESAFAYRSCCDI
jgi:hypothetical protein